MRLGLILVLLLAPPAVFAFSEPENFRGIPWGATQEEAREILGKAWRERASRAPHEVPGCPNADFCDQKGTLGPGPRHVHLRVQGRQVCLRPRPIQVRRLQRRARNFR